MPWYYCMYRSSNGDGADGQTHHANDRVKDDISRSQGIHYAK